MKAGTYCRVTQFETKAMRVAASHAVRQPLAFNGDPRRRLIGCADLGGQSRESATVTSLIISDVMASAL
ncbi:hypothetical protein [Bradyrhizobium sp. Ce-3]|uniref:hypothetical protein n=1 Tax=Bradyrhizobium sp. Ce-3 TaxID=2913970 RepID=UPI001FC8BB5F|nr:hypothetical protein [Bradyrhizobium sp. Ce-3]